MNLILDTDGYKLSHGDMYPPRTEALFSYIEARGFDKNYGFSPEYKANPYVVHFGSAIINKQYTNFKVTREMLTEAEAVLHGYGVAVDRQKWLDLIDKGGSLPITIRALRDGTVVPLGTPQLTVHSDEPGFHWLTSYLETSLLRTVWYASTVATISHMIKQTIRKHLNETSDDPEGQLPFKLHDFGARGVSSRESAEIGGLAHLINFVGTDTLSSLVAFRKFFGRRGGEGRVLIGASIPASEHSTITSWGKARELDAYNGILDKFAGKGKIVACVSDSYDIYNACEYLWGDKLHDKVIDSGATLVIRPDSGDPLEVIPRIFQILADRFGTKKNGRGFEVLNSVRVIQGDGVNPQMIDDLLTKLKQMRFSADNIAFGMGGALLQKVDRDTLKYAMKASAIRIDGEWKDVYKDPITDAGKRSKRGVQDTQLIEGKYTAVKLSQPRRGEFEMFTAKDSPSFVAQPSELINVIGKDSGQFASDNGSFVDVRSRSNEMPK